MRSEPLGKVAEINPGIPNGIGADSTQLVSFIPMAGVSESGIIVDIDTKRLGEVQKGYRYFEEGDILLAKITPCMENGKAALANGLPYKLGFGSTEFHVIRPGDDSDAHYLFHMVWNPHFRFVAARNMTGSAGQKRVPAGFLERFQIPFPPLEEQKRIAAILDKADAIRRKRAEVIRLTKTFLRSVFLEMFGDPMTNPKGWPIVKLANTFAKNPQIGTIVPAQESGQQLVVRVGEIGDYNVAIERCKAVTLQGSELQRFLLKPGDFLLARAIGSQDHLGKASVLQGIDRPIVFDSHVMRLRFKSELLHPLFFLQWLKTEGGRARFMRRAGRTAVQFNINAKQIADIDVPLPPPTIQQDFVHISLKTRALLQRQEHIAQNEQALFNSLVQRAFRGEL
jgi:type I restriction enzyme S subunit